MCILFCKVVSINHAWGMFWHILTRWRIQKSYASKRPHLCLRRKSCRNNKRRKRQSKPKIWKTCAGFLIPCKRKLKRRRKVVRGRRKRLRSKGLRPPQRLRVPSPRRISRPIWTLTRRRQRLQRLTRSRSKRTRRHRKKVPQMLLTRPPRVTRMQRRRRLQRLTRRKIRRTRKRKRKRVPLAQLT